jgi:chemotaxis methyl-accepting protein methylase
MTVSIGRFFRDRRLWELLETEILPAIIREHGSHVKVWAAGCACGEEVYSLKILWETLCRRFDPCPDLEIWASDMNPIYLNKARTGIYTRSSLKEVPEALRAAYFRPLRKQKRYAISEGLKQGILWREHNLLFDFSGTNFHLVFLRNSVLTYYENKLKVAAFQKVLDRLAQGGFLIIGSHERIPPGEWGLVPFGRVRHVFQKKVSI